jgi:protein-S-isoprenylcysteine O-methyltransferase Ste14
MKINADHWTIMGYWILFSIVHHFTASEKIKAVCRLYMHAGFRYYRLIYSLIAILTLSFVMYKQFTIKSFGLGIAPWLKNFIGIPFGELGIGLMGVSIYKYFFKLSGISIFFHENSSGSLELHGIHKYVRHPLYLGTLLFIWSLFLFFPLLSNLQACVVITLYVLIGIRSEERKLVTLFGQDYESYRHKTPGLIPNIRL